MFEVQEVLAALRHHLQVGQQVQKLGEFVLHSEERTILVKLHFALHQI